MNRKDRGLLVGMLLGDGCLRVRDRLKDGKYLYKQAELRVKHSSKQKAYAEHKAELVAQMFGGACKVHDTSSVAFGAKYSQVYFTKSNPYFRALYSVVYPEGKKRITRRVLNYLTPQGIALWYLDDGSARVNRNSEGWVSSCATEIATCCTLDEAEEIVAYFKAVHDIVVKPFKLNTYWCIRMNTAESQKFCRLIAQYVPASMLYKLQHVSNLNVQECRTPAVPCRTCGTPTRTADRRKGLCLSCYHKQNRGR